MLGAPTASGKSQAAVELALQLRPRLNIEIVTADAMQVYRGMDIGTAKPTRAEQELVAHHLIDLVTPAEPFSVAAWVAAAERVIGEILARGALPLVVGGSGFYLSSLARGLPLVPPAEPSRQQPIQAELAAHGPGPLLAELRAAAPADAERAGLNPRRIVRAVEILRATGRPPSSFGRSVPAYRFDQLVLLPTAEQLAPRIRQRAESMFELGLISEVASLQKQWPEQLTALQAIGYKEVIDHLNGAISAGEALDAVELATRRYAKRQLTWFRRVEQARSLRGLAADHRSELAAWLLQPGA